MCKFKNIFSYHYGINRVYKKFTKKFDNPTCLYVQGNKALLTIVIITLHIRPAGRLCEIIHIAQTKIKVRISKVNNYIYKRGTQLRK